MIHNTQGCPCGSDRVFSLCCEPLLRGIRNADDARQLMRSRYSAFATGALDYLERTHHPSRRSATERAELQAQAGTLQWLALQICDSVAGNAGEPEGEVEFKAYFRAANDLRCLHERSRFVFENDQWFYVDAVFCDDRRVAPGRNEPCFCGSERKFKQCHGRA
jgi:SEC-C motif-containing protein